MWMLIICKMQRLEELDKIHENTDLLYYIWYTKGE